VLIHDGRILYDRLRAEHITMDDLEAALRRGSIADPTRARFAVIEESGGTRRSTFGGGSRPLPPASPQLQDCASEARALSHEFSRVCFFFGGMASA
jgi:Protein of unknown function (DUF421)